MTYKELLELLQTFTLDQLEDNACLYHNRDEKILFIDSVSEIEDSEEDDNLRTEQKILISYDD